jgi:hypothetical protein
MSTQEDILGPNSGAGDSAHTEPIIDSPLQYVSSSVGDDKLRKREDFGALLV